MRVDQWWKNFGMGIELDASGAFIYNAIRQLHVIETLNHPVDIFEILYGLSVGIERLQKVVIILLEHDIDGDIEQLEESLITHNTVDLSNRIDAKVNQSLSGVHKELLSILSKFYKTHRYSRYSISSVPTIDSEKKLLIEYLAKHLKIELPDDDSMFGMPNSDQIKKFVGKIVKRITKNLYEIISNRARELNLYTYELRIDSKAMKVFMGERLDFLDEDKIRREMLLYLMHPDSDGDHIRLIRNYDALDLDPGLAPAYIKSLINDSQEHLGYVSGEIEEQYSDIDDVSERFGFLSIMDNEYLSYEP